MGLSSGRARVACLRSDRCRASSGSRLAHVPRRPHPVIRTLTRATATMWHCCGPDRHDV